jgi:hypothetical protein
MVFGNLVLIHLAMLKIINNLAVKFPCLPVHIYIRVIAKLPNSEQSYKGKVKTNKYINRQNQSTTGKL